MMQVQCDNDPDNERDPGEQVVSSRDPMLSSITSPDNTKMWRSLSTESMDDAESLVYYKVEILRILRFTIHCIRGSFEILLNPINVDD